MSRERRGASTPCSHVSYRSGQWVEGMASPTLLLRSLAPDPSPGSVGVLAQEGLRVGKEPASPQPDQSPQAFPRGGFDTSKGVRFQPCCGSSNSSLPRLSQAHCFENRNKHSSAKPQARQAAELPPTPPPPGHFPAATRTWRGPHSSTRQMVAVNTRSLSTPARPRAQPHTGLCFTWFPVLLPSPRAKKGHSEAR